jgi:hypothetical protein
MVVMLCILNGFLTRERWQLQQVPRATSCEYGMWHLEKSSGHKKGILVEYKVQTAYNVSRPWYSRHSIIRSPLTSAYSIELYWRPNYRIHFNSVLAHSGMWDRINEGGRNRYDWQTIVII